MRFADLSNMQRPLDTDDITSTVALGIGGVAVGCQYPGAPYPPGDAHLDFATIEADGRLLCFPYFENTPVDVAWPHIEAFVASPCFLPFGAIAVEDNSGFTDEAIVDQQIAAVRVRGLQPVIYTSPYMLQKYGLLDAAKRWAAEGVLFWFASYNGADDLQVPTDLPVWGKQYTEHGDGGFGFEVDLDEFNVTAPAAPAPAVEPAWAAAAASTQTNMEEDLGDLTRLDTPKRLALFEAWANEDVTDDTIVAESDAPPSPQYRRFVVDIPVEKATTVPA